MPYLQLALNCPSTAQAAYVAALEDVGAEAITLLDADANTLNEEAIFEPAPGETPVWDQVTITALFPNECDALALLVGLKESAPHLAWQTVHFSQVADRAWERVWLDHYQAMRFGLRTFIVPWSDPLPAEATQVTNPAIIRLDPGLAFGSGTHPTTALCLEWLDDLAQRGLLDGQDILDVGCGSGILAIAAVKLGAAFATAIDTDPQALEATRDNAQRNDVGRALHVCSPPQAPQRSYRYVVANILATTLDSLAANLIASVAPTGAMALSGILAGQETALIDRFQPWFNTIACVYADGWVRLDLRDRRHDTVPS